MRPSLVSLIMVILFATAPPGHAEQVPVARTGAAHAVPLYGELVRPWQAPEDDPFAAGHRGIDIAAAPGTPVRASAAGVVTFAGSVAGNRTVTVDHGDGIRTTYSFLGAVAVTSGRSVTLGEVVGTVGTGHASAGLPPHVHLAARRADVYFDPIRLYVGDSAADLLALVA